MQNITKTPFNEQSFFNNHFYFFEIFFFVVEIEEGKNNRNKEIFRKRIGKTNPNPSIKISLSASKLISPNMNSLSSHSSTRRLESDDKKFNYKKKIEVSLDDGYRIDQVIPATTTSNLAHEKMSKTSLKFATKISTPLTGKIAIKSRSSSLQKLNIPHELPKIIRDKGMRGSLSSLEQSKGEVGMIASQIFDDRPTTSGTDFLKFKSGSVASINDRIISTKRNSMHDSILSNFHSAIHPPFSSFTPNAGDDNLNMKIDFDILYDQLENLNGRDKKLNMDRAALGKYIGKQCEQLELNKMKLSMHELEVLSDYEKNLLRVKNPSSTI